MSTKGNPDASLRVEERDIFMCQRYAWVAALFCLALQLFITQQLKDRTAAEKECPNARGERSLRVPCIPTKTWKTGPTFSLCLHLRCFCVAAGVASCRLLSPGRPLDPMELFHRSSLLCPKTICVMLSVIFFFFLHEGLLAEQLGPVWASSSERRKASTLQGTLGLTTAFRPTLSSVGVNTTPFATAHVQRLRTPAHTVTH